MRDLSEQCGILTGATSGVGRAVAKLLAERGTRLVISGRRESRLVELASEYPGLLIPLPGDITKSEFQEELVEKARVAFGGIDLVIAAAGAGAVGPFSESSLNVMRSVFEIDFFAPIELVFKSLPQLKKLLLIFQKLFLGCFVSVSSLIQLVQTQPPQLLSLQQSSICLSNHRVKEK